MSVCKEGGYTHCSNYRPPLLTTWLVTSAACWMKALILLNITTQEGRQIVAQHH